MLRRTALTCLVAGTLVPLLASILALSRAFVARSGGDAAEASKAIRREMPWLLEVSGLGVVLIVTGLVLLFATRRQTKTS